MKRQTRISPNALCLIPGKAIAWLMLAMAVLTIFSFISIELRRILWLKTYSNGKKPSTSFEQQSMKINSTTPYYSNDILAFDVTEKRTTPIPRWNSAFMDDIFSDHPSCKTRLFLLVLVASAPENFEQRDSIRKSWANVNKRNRWTNGLKAKTVFLIGRSSSRFLNTLLRRENEISGDILLGDYLDTYRNLTVKVLHGLTWALSHCHPSYTLKTDDDCFVNLNLLLHFLWKINPIRSNLYAGRVRWSSPVIRNPNSRWYVSGRDFMGSHFAPYVSGAGYVLSLDVLKKFVEYSGMFHVFPNEDAYVGTVLNMAAVRPTYSARFVTHSGSWQLCNFLYLFVIHHVKPVRQGEFQEMADRAIDGDQCSKAELANDWV